MYFILLVFCVKIRCILFYIVSLRAALCKACAFNECRISDMDFVIPQIKKKNAMCLFYFIKRQILSVYIV